MKMKEILDNILILAQSQGMYGRLYERIMSLEAEEYGRLAEELEAQNFTDIISIIFYFEC